MFSVKISSNTPRPVIAHNRTDTYSITKNHISMPMKTSAGILQGANYDFTMQIPRTTAKI